MGRQSYQVVDANRNGSGRCCTVRGLIVFMGFLATFVMFTNRVNINLAIVCMTDGQYADNGTNMTTSSSIASAKEPEFDWNSSRQGIILSSFFIGYLLTQVPTGWIIPKFKASPKWLIFGGIAVTVTLSFLSPTAAYGGWGYLVAVQILKGMACGTFYPSLQQIVIHWAPPNERSRMTSIVLSGDAIGSVVTFASSGYLCEYGFAGGWPSVFYTYAIITLVWMVLWVVLVSDSPRNHRFISKEEKNYIEKASADTGAQNNAKTPVPWGSILTSPAVWAIVVADFAFHWMWYTALILMPTYFNDVLNFDITTNGLLSSLPYIVNYILTVTGGIVADFLIKCNVRVGIVRRILDTFGLMIPTCFVIATGFLDESQRGLAVASLAISVGHLGLLRSGHIPNEIDIAPKFGAVLMAIVNSISTFPGIIAPIVAGVMTPNKSQEEWRNVFFLAAGFTCLGEIVFLIFARGEVQPWAKIEEEKEIHLNDDEDC